MSFLALPLLIPAIALCTLIMGVFSTTPNSLNSQHIRVIWVTTNIKELNHLACNIMNIISMLFSITLPSHVVVEIPQDCRGHSKEVLSSNTWRLDGISRNKIEIITKRIWTIHCKFTFEFADNKWSE
jgi:hypothetical protein